MRFERPARDLLPELMLEDDAYTPTRDALERHLSAGEPTPEAVKGVAAELDEEARRQMVELGLLCLVFGTFD